MRILIAEDRPEILEVLIEMTKHLGHEVVTATDGFSALKVIRDGEVFGAILTDNDMPGMRGTELLRWFRMDVEKNPRTKLIISSGDAGSQEILRLCREFPDIIMKPKPLMLDELRECLDV